MRMSADEIAAGWKSVGGHTAPPPSDRMYSPLGESIDSFVRWAQSPQERINLGIARIDAEMRGIAPGEIAMVLGFAHGGKTLLLLHSLKHNKEKQCVFEWPFPSLFSFLRAVHFCNSGKKQKSFNIQPFWLEVFQVLFPAGTCRRSVGAGG